MNKFVRKKFKPAIVWNSKYAQHAELMSHPEKSSRVEAVLKSLASEGLLSLENGIQIYRSQPAEIVLCHDARYVELVKQFCSQLGDNEISFLPTGDSLVCRESFQIGQDAVSAVTLAIDLVFQGEYPSAFAVIRPPGHHAESCRGMGFCLFNNVAIGARIAQKKWGVKKVSIIDWDLHHGNGTHEIFLHDESVQYISTHQRGIYPGTGEYECRGLNGERLISVPIDPGLGSRSDLMDFYSCEVPRLLMEFSPSLILISCGFDAHERDPLGSLSLKSEDYGELTKIVTRVAQEIGSCKVISALEGGYDIQALSESSIFHVKNLPHF